MASSSAAEGNACGAADRDLALAALLRGVETKSSSSTSCRPRLPPFGDECSPAPATFPWLFLVLSDGRRGGGVVSSSLVALFPGELPPDLPLLVVLVPLGSASASDTLEERFPARLVALGESSLTVPVFEVSSGSEASVDAGETASGPNPTLGLCVERRTGLGVVTGGGGSVGETEDSLADLRLGESVWEVSPRWPKAESLDRPPDLFRAAEFAGVEGTSESATWSSESDSELDTSPSKT